MTDEERQAEERRIKDGIIRVAVGNIIVTGVSGGLGALAGKALGDHPTAGGIIGATLGNVAVWMAMAAYAGYFKEKKPGTTQGYLGYPARVMRLVPLHNSRFP